MAPPSLHCDRLGQHIDVLVLFLHLAKSVVVPVVLEVLIDLLVQRVGQGFVLSEPGQQSHPVVEFECWNFALGKEDI